VDAANQGEWVELGGTGREGFGPVSFPARAHWRAAGLGFRKTECDIWSSMAILSALPSLAIDVDEADR
jgi:hypothetical protein